VFGPVVCVYTYDALDKAIGRANALPVAFQAAIFTRDYGTAVIIRPSGSIGGRLRACASRAWAWEVRAYTRLDASAVMLNGISRQP